MENNIYGQITSLIDYKILLLRKDLLLLSSVGHKISVGTVGCGLAVYIMGRQEILEKLIKLMILILQPVCTVKIYLKIIPNLDLNSTGEANNYISKRMRLGSNLCPKTR